MRPTERFSDRVDDYIRYRPGYPPEALNPLIDQCHLGASSTVADIGAGTGIWTSRLLDTGCSVLALEPNQAMRRAGRSRLGEERGVTWLDGTAEATGLAAGSVDLATAAQAFHWFERQPARAELARVLGEDGWMAVIWNERRKQASPFSVAYENLLMAFAIDYAQLDHSQIGRRQMADFFAPLPVREFSCRNHQPLDLAGLEGRLRSCSYAPGPDHPNHLPMFAELRRIFTAEQQDGLVTMEYDCRVYFGQLG